MIIFASSLPSSESLIEQLSPSTENVTTTTVGSEEEEESSTVTESTESIISTTPRDETVNLLGGLQPSGGERLIDLLKKIGANTKSKFNVPGSNDTDQLVRSDKRCGASYKLTNGSVAECDPYSDFYCCSKWGFCGDTEEHCNCPDCVDYRKHYSLNITTEKDATNDVASEDQMFRFDGRCGVDALLPNGAPAQCDPTGEYFCCSKYGHCGNTEEHCNCSDCVDYRNPSSKVSSTTEEVTPKATTEMIDEWDAWIKANDPETPVPLEDGKENGGDKMHSAWIIIMICSLIVTEMLNFV